MFVSDDTLVSLLESDLFSSGWNGSLEPYPGQPTKQFAYTSLRNSLVKKYLPGTSPKNPVGDAKAIALFLECNSLCGKFNLSSSPRTEVEEVVIGEVKSFLYDFCYPRPNKVWYTDVPTKSVRSYATSRDPIYYDSKLLPYMDVGPGASIGSKSTNFYTKFANSKLSSTSAELHRLYVQLISYNPTWQSCELLRAHMRESEVTSGSRLSCVAKNRKISRTICTEPLLNMIFQKGLGGVIEERLREVVGTDLSTQPDENARLAQIGSLTGKFGTIDLSSASDTISLSLIRDLFPAGFVRQLEKFRSPKTTLPGGEIVDLHMISSMGNAYTFPLQTVLFTAVVHAVYTVLGIPFKHWHSRTLHRGKSTFAVFGDDIIVVREAYDLTCRILSLFGFKVNMDKSFNEGFFRESCGADFYYGRNVRGVYLEHLRDIYDCFSAINRLCAWSAEHSTPLPRLVSFLAARVPKVYVPYQESDDAGIKVPFSLASGYKYEPSGLVSYRPFHLEVMKLKLPVRNPSVQKRYDWFYNPYGLLLTLTAGRISHGSVGLRTKNRRAKRLRRICPCWDWIPLAGGESPQYRENWKVLTEVNLIMD